MSGCRPPAWQSQADVQSFSWRSILDCISQQLSWFLARRPRSREAVLSRARKQAVATTSVLHRRETRKLGGSHQIVFLQLAAQLGAHFLRLLFGVVLDDHLDEQVRPHVFVSLSIYRLN